MADAISAAVSRVVRGVVGGENQSRCEELLIESFGWRRLDYANGVFARVLLLRESAAGLSVDDRRDSGRRQG